MSSEGVVVLAGGVGAARFLTGLVDVLPPESVTAIVNTGDDEEFHGLYVCPDVDIVTYTLAGVVDRGRGWGISGDTFNCLEMLGRLGRQTWFNLGDRDLAIHIHRTFRRKQGWGLDEITDEIRRCLGIRSGIIPMTNDRVATKIDTGDRLLPFQEYFVRRAAEDRVRRIVLEGIETAHPSPRALQAILHARAIIIAPSNPFVSIAPILSVSGIRDALRSAGAPVAAISPIVRGTAIKGPAASMMSDLGHEVTALGIARLYQDIVDTIVLDTQDAELAVSIEELGIRAVPVDTIMDSLDKKKRLAAAVLGALGL